MSAALAFWAQKLEPGKKIKLDQQEDLDIKITGVTFDENLVDQGRTSVKVHLHDAESGDTASFVLANLLPGKIESQLLDLIVSGDEKLEFEVVGKNTVYLSGNLIYQTPPADDGESDDEDEDALLLEDVSSDVEMNPDEFMDEDEDEEGRFEEIEDEPVVAPKPDASKKATKEKNSGSKGKSQTPATNPNKPSGDKQFGNKPSENKFSGNKPTSSQPFGGKPFGDKPRGDNNPSASNGGPGQGKKHHNKNKNKNKSHA